jgi:hypothetical protein
MIDVETVLRREADIVAAHFPDQPRAEIDELVHETYSELDETATVKAHLVAVTGAVVSEHLREGGAEFHAAGDVRES